MEDLQNRQNQMLEELSQIRDSTRVTLEKQNSFLERLLSGVLTIADSTTREKPLTDCRLANSSGLYQIRCDKCSSHSPVLCEMDSFDGGWLVVQHRFDGSVNFTRSWKEYQSGFGLVGKSTEFWLGLKLLHLITTSGDYELVIELKDKINGYGYAHYSDFKVSDSLRRQTDFQFTTFDNDNDNQAQNCAIDYLGGWWYGSSACGSSDLNGKFTGNADGYGIYWEGRPKASTFSRMMIRRK
ncbi:ficolin-1-like [Culex quinquefasciatus]|uniref:ficolin-1-like n=1 Tax=Culex quinquefasciatus TaxID=7176 RepID=UPI0018E392F8|nr:ficolin-1-like [Culex quinquefasciatus]